MENEKPGYRHSERPHRIERAGGELGGISAAALEILRSATIPAEFLKVVHGTTSRRNLLGRFDRESLTAPTEIEEPFNKWSMADMPIEPGVASPTDRWPEELPEPELATPFEPVWEEWAGSELKMPPESPEDVRTEGGAQTFYLTHLKLDLSGVSHVTRGLLQWEDAPLERIVTDTYPVLFDEEDGEPAPGEVLRGDGEELPAIAPTCHCQGGRLAIVIGENDDTAVRGALHWVATTSLEHLHRVYFAAPLKDTFTLFQPQILVKNGDGRKTWKKFPGKDPIMDLVKSYRDCCYYEEVVIFAHGGQRGLYRGLADLLPRFLDRPVKKLVFWVCGGNRESFPFSDDNKRADFESI
jgi:hypothetical protein